jgi:hypothetical protein
MPYKNLTATVTSRCPGVRVAGNNVSIDVDYLVYGRYIGYLFDIEYNIDYDDFPDRSSMSYATINLEYTGGPRENYCYLKIRTYGNVGNGSQTNIDFTTGYEDSFYVDTNKEGRNTCSIFFSMAENEHLFRTFKGSVYSFNVKNIEQSYNVEPLERPTSLSPSNTTINPRIANRFSWDSTISPDGYTFSYKVNNESEESFTKYTKDKFYIMPANTITADTGTIEWSVQAAKKLKDSNGYEFSAPVFAEATLGAVDQKAPILTYPVGDYVKNDGNITLKWDFTTNTTEEQASAEIKYKAGASSWRTATVGSQTQYKLSSITSTFNDAIYWQVRVKNQYDQWSNWSDVEQFQVIGIPPIPTIISVSNQNKPLIKWQSVNQEAFTLSVLQEGKSVYESDIIVGSAIKEHRINKWLNNGKHTIGLKIYTKYGVESPTATYTLDIKPDIKITNPTIRIFDIRYGVMIRSSSDNGEVYRDGVYIGSLKNGEYRDYTGTNGKNSIYYVRATEDYSFIDSDNAQGITNLLGKSTLATMDNPEDFVLLEYNLDADPKRNLSLEIESKEIALNNRKYNFTEYGIKEKETLTVNYLVDEIKKLKKLLQERKTLIYRDSYGFIIEGTISDINSELTIFGYLVSFTITKIGDKYE